MSNIKKFDIVKCPFDEIGLVRKVETHKVWGNEIVVEIINTPNIFNNIGDMVEYQPKLLKVVKELHF